jgi:hypothetical protein
VRTPRRDPRLEGTAALAPGDAAAVVLAARLGAGLATGASLGLFAVLDLEAFKAWIACTLRKPSAGADSAEP